MSVTGEYQTIFMQEENLMHEKYLVLKLFLFEGLSFSLLSLLERSLLVIHSPSMGEVVLGLTEVVGTLACLMGGKVQIKLHSITFLAQVHKEPISISGFRCITKY